MTQQEKDRLKKQFEDTPVPEGGWPFQNLSLKDMPGEKWLPLAGAEKYYMVSNMGRFKAIPTTWGYLKLQANPNSKMRYKTSEEKILHQRFNNKITGNYLIVAISLGIKKGPKLTHRLIAKTWISNPDKKPFVNHTKGRRWDNKTTEIEWITKIENERHAWKTLNRFRVKGEQVGRNVYPETTIREIILRRRSGERTIDLAREFGIGKGYVTAITNRRVWKHLVV